MAGLLISATLSSLLPVSYDRGEVVWENQCAGLFDRSKAKTQTMLRIGEYF